MRILDSSSPFNRTAPAGANAEHNPGPETFSSLATWCQLAHPGPTPRRSGCHFRTLPARLGVLSILFTLSAAAQSSGTGTTQVQGPVTQSGTIKINGCWVSPSYLTLKALPMTLATMPPEQNDSEAHVVHEARIVGTSDLHTFNFA